MKPSPAPTGRPAPGRPDPGAIETDYAAVVPIVHSAPFCFESTQEMIDTVEGRSARRQPEYGRVGNPTVRYVETRLAELEGAETALLFSSGMNAIATLTLALLKSGDHLVLTADCYRRTRDFAAGFLSRYGVETTVAGHSADDIERAVRPETRLVFTEFPTNPHLHVVDLEALATLGRRRGIATAVDATFATPINCQPLALGVNMVVHSATKYLGGHNDLIAGVAAGQTAALKPLAELRANLGGICDPNTAFLLDRGLKTLPLRVARHNATGQAVAEFLETHPRIKKVYYPGLPSHPHHAIAKRLMRGFGGVVSFEIDGNFEQAAGFVDALRLPLLAPSLGAVDSLVEQPIVMGYWGETPDELARWNVSPSLVRLSVGLEEPQAIVDDLKRALDSIV